MPFYKEILLVACAIVCLSSLKAQSLDLIPAPANHSVQDGNIDLYKGIALNSEIPPSAMKAYRFLRFTTHFGYFLRLGNKSVSIKFIEDKLQAEKAFKLISDVQGIEVRASSESGFFHACQTLAQLIEMKDNRKFPLFKIEDSPAFSWRGLHLDVSRHFFPVAEVKKILKAMSFYRLNVFHWHLTDDQGWRIEIKRYPDLTRIGSSRPGTLLGHASLKPLIRDNTPYSGFYSQDEIRSVVSFADSLGITVVPEIEMPGHAQAAVSAYPWLGITGKNPGVWTDWGVSPFILSPKDSVFTFLENVLTEVMELFPSKYIHIGGDEAIKDQWKFSAYVQAKIKELGLKDEHELQSWFIRRIEKFVNSKGRQIIGWDEILEGGLAPNAAVMSWRGEAGGIQAARMKHPVVMSPGNPLYFDHYQSESPSEPLAIGGLNNLQKVYNYYPLPDSLKAAEKEWILGAQGNLWTEYIAGSDQLEYMAFPRAIALAELTWTKKDQKDYQDFLRRLDKHRKVLKRMDLKFRDWKND
jgi:hexosaminidase